MKRLVSPVRMKWSRRNTLRVVAQIVVLALIASPIVKAAPPGGAPSSQKGPARKALHADDQVVGFSGYMKDPETGLYYAKARYYDPAVGRFTNEDPEPGHDFEPPSLHRYLYAYANPTTYADRTGRQSTGVGDEAFGYLKLSEQDEWALRERANQLAIDAHRPIMKPALQVIASAWREFNNVVDNFKSSTSGDVPGPFEDISVNEERELRVAAERESARDGLNKPRQLC
jgi:RHS repeat-associated protein